MADKKISQLTAAAALTGSEPIPTVQGGITVQTTAQDIADLAAGGGSFFPNGVEVVTATRDFQESDIGKFLVLTNGVGLTMPTSAPFYPNNKLIGIFAGSTNYPCDNFYERFPGERVYLYGAGHANLSSNESFTLLTVSNFDNSQQTVAPVNGTPVFVNESDTVGYTATRYMMDNVVKSGNATLSSGTVTVNNSAIRTGAKIIISVDTPGGTQGFLSAPVASIVDETSFVINSSSATETSTVNYWFINP